jgi:hypothetical protein
LVLDPDFGVIIGYGRSSSSLFYEIDEATPNAVNTAGVDPEDTPKPLPELACFPTSSTLHVLWR